jgi:cytochrome c
MTIRRIGWPSGVAVFIAVVAATSALGLARGAHPLSNHGDRGRAASRLVETYGCGTCHTIRGIEGADGVVGPPLTGLDTRRMIAGRLPNTPANLARWISEPQAIDPGNAMPDTSVTRSQAAAIAGYLYTHS